MGRTVFLCLTARRLLAGWNVAAGAFAYGYARLALVGYKYVGADQLIGGPWPDNEPAVSCCLGLCAIQIWTALRHDGPDRLGGAVNHR